MKVLIVSTLNELSGSCVVIKNTILNSSHYSKHSIDLMAPEGDYLEPDIIMPGGTLSSVLFFVKNKKLLRSYDRVIVYTLRGVLLALLHRSSHLYVHELNLKAKLKYRICNFIINRCHIKTYGVSPKVVEKYNDCKLLPNFYTSLEGLVFHKENKFLMIANFSSNKGVYKLHELARKNPRYEFVLLTKSTTENYREIIDFTNTATSNLSVVTDQSQKISLLMSSKYILNLSLLDESFGMTLFEGAQYSCLPISYKQSGAEYLLGDTLFLKHDLSNFEEVVLFVEHRYDKKPLNEQFSLNFNPKDFYHELFSSDIA